VQTPGDKDLTLLGLKNEDPATIVVFNDAVANAVGEELDNVDEAINLKQNQLNGTGFVKASGTTISYDNNTYITNLTSTDDSLSIIGNDLSVNFPVAYTDGVDKFKVFREKLRTTPSTTKIIAVGDSTSDQTSQLVQLAGALNASEIIRVGGSLESFEFDGTTFPDYGTSGQTIQGFLSNPAATKGSTNIIAEQPDLIIFSYGINDVRTTSERTILQLKNDIITAVELFRDALPNCAIALRMPNSFTTTNSGSYVQQGAYGTIAEACQAKSNILFEAYKQLEGYWNDTDVYIYDSQNLYFGKTCMASSTVMGDGIHPNSTGYLGVFKQIFNKIGFSKIALSDGLVANAMSTNYPYPELVYGRIYDSKYFNIIEVGRWADGTAGYIDISNLFNAYESSVNIKKGDVILVNDIYFGTVENFATVTTSTQIRITGTYVTYSYTSGDIVTIARHKYKKNVLNFTYNQNRSWAYKKDVRISSAGTNYLDLTNDDGGYIPMTRVRIDVSTDFLVIEGETAIFPLTGATITYQTATTVRIGLTGSFSSLNAKRAVLYSNRNSEAHFDAIYAGSTAGTPSKSAIVDIVSTTQGILIPRMTTAQRTAISGPATGLIVFDTDLGALCYYNGAWKFVTFT